MGDRCYMTVWCRPQDVATFTAIGFIEEKRTEFYVHMVDEQANYAHSGDMPTDIPYTASHASGGDYGSAMLACDGERLVEIETGHSGGVVMAVDADGEIDDDDLRYVRKFYVTYNRAEKLVADAFRSAVFDAARQHREATTNLEPA